MFSKPIRKVDLEQFAELRTEMREQALLLNAALSGEFDARISELSEAREAAERAAGVVKTVEDAQALLDKANEHAAEIVAQAEASARESAEAMEAAKRMAEAEAAEAARNAAAEVAAMREQVEAARAEARSVAADVVNSKTQLDSLAQSILDCEKALEARQKDMAAFESKFAAAKAKAAKALGLTEEV